MFTIHICEEAPEVAREQLGHANMYVAICATAQRLSFLNILVTRRVNVKYSRVEASIYKWEILYMKTGVRGGSAERNVSFNKFLFFLHLFHFFSLSRFRLLLTMRWGHLILSHQELSPPAHSQSHCIFLTKVSQQCYILSILQLGAAVALERRTLPGPSKLWVWNDFYRFQFKRKSFFNFSGDRISPNLSWIILSSDSNLERAVVFYGWEDLIIIMNCPDFPHINRYSF